MSSKAYRVYVLQNADDRYYIGLTENVSVRLNQHNAGESKWTAKYRPWRLIRESPELSLGDARKLGNHLKRQKGGNGFRRLIGLPPGSYNPALAGSLVPRTRDPSPAPNL